MAVDEMAYEPVEFPPGSSSLFQDSCGTGWVPVYHHACTFAILDFTAVMLNLAKNPNLNSNWLFRADIIYDDSQTAPEDQQGSIPRPPVRDIKNYVCERTLIRTLVPRNTLRDAPINQTCYFYTSVPADANITKSLVIFTPHADCVEDLPYYHPRVRAIAHLIEWDATHHDGTISVHYLPFAEQPLDEKLQRVAYHLLEILNKHGHSTAKGYVKRVNHDIVIPKKVFQDRYSLLKNKYAADLVRNWAEVTDPSKHVFEDLGIAAFLIELWKDLYKDTEFPGFVDIGCGNGLLVYLLIKEGYAGWGFDARARKSWEGYNAPSPLSPSGNSLEQLLLLPSVVPTGTVGDGNPGVDAKDIHNGVFPPNTFIISNHADELTPWTPILATISECPFITIPCCSHNLAGDKWRAPPPRDKTKSKSTYSSLVEWVRDIGEDCGWEVETEMLRIPSTRNTCLLGRKRTIDASRVNIDAILGNHGGFGGYYVNVAKLLDAAPRGH